MNRLGIRATYRTTVAASLVLALLARVPLVDGLLLHDHGDDGVHTHTVTADDTGEVDLHAAWHRHHDDDRDDGNDDSDSGEHAESLFIFLYTPATAMSIRGSCNTVIASIRQLSSTVLFRAMVPSEPTDASRLRSPHPPRPVHALDALLQTSHALLL